LSIASSVADCYQLFRATAGVKWSYDIELKSVHDDELEISVNLPSNVKEGFKFNFLSGSVGGLGE
jgi:hypothetical protein